MYTIYIYIALSFLVIINLNLAFIIINALATIIIPFMLFLAFVSYKKGNNMALFYIVAQSTFMIGSFFFSLMADGYLEYNLFNRNAIVVGSFIEIIMFSLALGYRLRLLQSEKLEIIEKTNIELENKIEVRTLTLTSMLDRTMEAIGIYENHVLIETNDAAVKVYGYDSKEQMLGKRSIHFVAPESRRMVAKYMRDVYTEMYEARALRKDGSSFPVLVRGSHYESGGKTLGMVAVLDLSAIKEKEKQLILAKLEAEESTEAKSNFLANMSHEIRTPMNGIIGMAKLMEKTLLSEKQKYYLKTISTSSSSLLSIINDILDFSKIEAGKLEIDKIDFNLKHLVDDVVSIVEYKALEKGLLFEIVYDGNIPMFVNGDKLRISQILVNLLNNAIKFTHNGFVKLIIVNKENNFTFEVKDSGIGINKQDQSKLFKSFTQGDTSTTRKYGGTGLGLSISKELVKLLGGSIALESEIDKGSSFSFSINLQTSLRKVEEIHKKVYSIEELHQLNTSNILLVEDNIINQEIIIGLLDGSGINIYIANNGAQAVEMFSENKDRYELILMDLQMPVMGGIEATKIIRDTGSKIPIIALTANAMKEDVQLTKEVGMNEHLNKPIDLERLFEVLLTFVRKKSDKIELITKKSLDISIPKFQTIDSQLALKYLGSNKKLYMKILKDFYQKYKDFQLNDLEQEQLNIEIHTLKGLSANIGAVNLHLIVKEFELTKDEILKSKLYEELNLVLDELVDLNNKKDTEVKQEVGNDKIEELFLKLQQSAKTARPKECQVTIEELKKYKLDLKDTELLKSLENLVKTYKFKEILEVMKGI